MAKNASQTSRQNVKSTFEPIKSKVREEGLATTADVLGRKAKNFPEPPKVSDTSTARVISVVNQKGGVGKTTTAINLGAALAETGRRVLLIDFDSQASMTTGLGIKGAALREQYGSIWYLLNDSESKLEDFILKSTVPGLDFIRGHEDLAAAEAAFVSEIAKEHKLRKLLAPVLDKYDVVLIDCSPSLGTLTVNALTASNTMFEKKTGHSREVLELIDKEFPEEVFDTIISRTVRFSESTVAGQPVTVYASSSTGSTAYRRLARELINRGGSK
ncbi:MAG: ParA family protein [Actinobacteria bacterium]|nr:ParA family protein [Actinomycetota bacterium]